MRYERPQSIEDAVGLLAGSAGTAAILAGGSDLLVRMKGGFIEPDLIVDIKAIDGLSEIRETTDGFSIGAAVPCAVLGESTALKKAWPGVVEAAKLIGSKQVQGRCTIVGNLCNASPAADSVPALVAAGARASVVGPGGRRTIPVESVPTGPGKTSLAKGEIIEAILLDKRPPRSGDAYLRFIPRTEMDIAVVSAGVNLTLDEQGVVKAARVALGAVAPTVLLVEEAAEALIGRKLDEAALERLAKVCFGGLPPHRRQAGYHRVQKEGCGCAGQAGRHDRICTCRRQMMAGVAVSTTINGDNVEYLCQPDETLLDVLRDRLGLTGAKEGCGTGDCGACSIILDDRLVCSCLVLGAEAEGRRVETIEGMAHGDKLHPLQQKFLEHAALQCGICTPGFLMAAKDLLAKNPDPTEEEIRFGLAGNLCRCTGYDKIVRAVQDAASVMKGA